MLSDMDCDILDMEGSWRITKQPVIVHQNSTTSQPTLVDPPQCIQELRALLPTRPDVAFYRSDAEFLHRFLKTKKYRVNDAFNTLCKYFIFRRQHRDLCVGLSSGASGVQAALSDGVVGVLPENDPCGRPILIMLASNWDFSRYDVRTVYQTVLVTLEYLLKQPTVQDTGIIAIMDWTDFPSKYATSLSPKTIRMFLDGLQDAFPLRVGAIHVVNPPWYIEAGISLSKPFLKEKLKDRVLVHGNNLHSLHSSVPPRLLPAELGGEGGEYHAVKWASTLISSTKDDPPTIASLSNTTFSMSFDSTITHKDPMPNETKSLTGSLLKIS